MHSISIILISLQLISSIFVFISTTTDKRNQVFAEQAKKEDEIESEKELLEEEDDDFNTKM